MFGKRSRWMSRGVAILVAAALVGGACTPVPEPPDPGGPDPELLAMLDDPEFVAQFGETQEERDEIVAQIRDFLDEGSDWDLDPDALRQMAEEKAAADALAEQQATNEQAAEEAEIAREADRLKQLRAGPSYDEVIATQTDGSEDYDYSLTAEHWAGMEGAAQAHEANAAEIARVDQLVDAEVERLRALGELEKVDQIPGYVPPAGEGWPLFAQLWADKWVEREPATGACTGRDGNRSAPKNPGLRAGTIYTPVHNTFAKTGGSPVFSGNLRTTYIGGKKHVIVEGHLGDLDDLGALPNTGNIWAQLRARLTIHLPETVASDHDGAGPYMTPWIPGNPIESGTVQVLCYTQDYHPEPGEQIRRAMYRAYVPWEDLSQNSVIDDPGFQVRTTVTELQYFSSNGWQPQWFWGADMRTVYLGEQPLSHNEAFDNGGFGVSVGSGVIVDRNNYTGDDLESSLRAPVSNAITNTLSGLDGTAEWVWGKSGGSWGWVGFHINNSNPTTPNVDIDWDPTKLAGSNDDEYRLKGTVSMNDWLIEGYSSLPFAFLGLIPCYFRMKVNWSATIYASVDINDGAPTILQPDIEFGNLGLGVHSMFASPLPLGCNAMYLFHFASKWADKVNAMLPSVNANLGNQMSVQPNIDDAVPATIPLAGGGAMHAAFLGFNDTCVPYGCNGSHAGDMAMSWAGLEASGDIRFTDNKTPWAIRRFPLSYSPKTQDTANGRIRRHFGPQNEITDFGAWVNPSVLNQALRAIAEEGVLDINFDATTPGTAKSPPIYLDKPISANKPLGLFLPHLELDPQADANLFAVDFYAGIGVGFDNGTRKLVPAPVSPSDPAVGVQLWTLNCAGILWATCSGIPAIASDVLNWGANTLLDPLLQNSIGEVTIPNTGGFSLTNLKVLNEDGHLGIRTSVGAPSLTAWGGINASTYSFDTYYEGFNGSGDVTYNWTIIDNVSGATIMTYTGPNHQFTGLDSTALTPLNIPGLTLISAKATVTASRGGTVKTATHTVTTNI